MKPMSQQRVEGKLTRRKRNAGQEKYVVKAVLDYLRLKRIFCWRNNTGGFMRNYVRKDRTEGEHFYRFGEIGSPDIFAVKNGKIYGIECKGENGKLSETQEGFGKELEKAGGIYVVTYGIKDVERVGL